MAYLKCENSLREPEKVNLIQIKPLNTSLRKKTSAELHFSSNSGENQVDRSEFHRPRELNKRGNRSLLFQISRYKLYFILKLIALEAYLICNMVMAQTVTGAYRARMVRLCIASVDPAKLSSQCVMCNRREFPLTVIDCTGINKMNDLIASPLSVQDATCLIYNCRRQVPDIKPEPYHGTAAVRTNYPSASGVRSYEIMPPQSMYDGGYSALPSMSRYTGYPSPIHSGGIPISASSSNIISGRQPTLPYALVPAHYSYPFGSRKFRAALIPLFKR